MPSTNSWSMLEWLHQAAMWTAGIYVVVNGSESRRIAHSDFGSRPRTKRLYVPVRRLLGMHTDRTSNLIGFPFNSMLNHAVGIVVGWYANFIRPVLVR